jgi:mRNA interferase MazF
VVTDEYAPHVGDIVWLHFDPQSGHEQAGRRPALVLTPVKYNRRRGMLVCCPLTTRLKAYPFQTLIEGEPRSAALVDQVKSLDWRARRAKPKGKATNAELAEVRAKLKSLLSL